MTQGGALDGLVVLDLTTNIAGPYCTMLLGDMGAEVIKIEAPERGDPARTEVRAQELCAEAPMFLAVNRNKRSIEVNLAHPLAGEWLTRAVQRADIVVDSLGPGRVAKYGLSPERALELNPRLIYCSVSGFGLDNSRSSLLAYDNILQAFAGVMSLTVEDDGLPSRIPVSAVDVATGTLAYGAVVTALLARERTGKGQRIDMSLYDGALNLMSYWIPQVGKTGVQPEGATRFFAPLSPIGMFRAKDAYFTLGVGSDGTWVRFCAAIGAPELAAHPDFATNEGRVANRPDLVTALEKIFAAKTAREWVEVLTAANVAASDIVSVSEVLSHPFTAERAGTVAVERAGQSLPVPGMPLRLSEHPPTLRAAPPALGADLRTGMHSLGFNDAAIDRYLKAGLFSRSATKPE